MTEENVAYLTLNDEKHEIDKLSNQQKFMCSQMQNLQQRSMALTADLDVVNRALQSVQNDLIASLEKEDAQVLAS